MDVYMTLTPTVTPEQIPRRDAEIPHTEVCHYQPRRLCHTRRQGALGVLRVALQKLEQRHQRPWQGQEDILPFFLQCSTLDIYFAAHVFPGQRLLSISPARQR